MIPGQLARILLGCESADRELHLDHQCTNVRARVTPIGDHRREIPDRAGSAFEHLRGSYLMGPSGSGGAAEVGRRS